MEIGQALAGAAPGTGPWMNGRRWDLGWIIGSAVIVPAVLLFVWAGVPSTPLDLAVTALVGGPHLFATYTVTYLDPRFRRSHRTGLLAVSLLIPAFVVWAAIFRYQVLVSVFIFWASVHVLQQNAYLADVYRKRFGRTEPPWSRWIDYGMLMLSFYPAAAYRLVHQEFMVAGVKVLIPSFLLVPATYWLVWIGFTAFTAAWLAKTVVEWLWLVQRLRREQGKLESPAMAWLNAPRRGWRLYAACTATTIVLLGATELVKRADPLGLQPGQYYFMMVLSALLIHYALDMYLFGFSLLDRARRLDLPYSAPVARVEAA